MAQVYNVHSARMPPYHPNRYYDHAEPPPAHRPLTSHGGMPHPLGTPDRPRSGHSALSAHMPAQQAGHGPMGAGLGAAGNIMGAAARHIGADTPTSQRGLQAATPPHASQVPPQAESLEVILKVGELY